MNIDLAGVILAALSRFVLGALWYGPFFGQAWMKEVKMDKHKMNKSGQSVMYGTVMVISIVSAFVLAMFLGNELPLVADVLASASVGVVWVAGAIAVNYMFAGNSRKLFLIDAGYHAVAFTLMGLIIGMFQ